MKVWLNRAGSAIGLVGVGFVGVKLWEYSDQLGAVRLDAVAYAVLILLAAVYGLSNVCLALAWQRILRHLNVVVSTRWSLRVYGLSQLGKYVPGNIFQFAGRQALGAGAGLPNWPLAKSSGLELGLIALGGLMFGPLLAGWWWGLSGNASAAASLGLFAVTVSASLLFARAFAGHQIAAALAFQLTFLCFSGAAFLALMALLDDASIALASAPIIVGAYVLAWLAGLVTPGAPAGLGVREAVLLYLLAGMSSEASILLAVLMGRAVTVGGDFLFYAFARLSRDDGQPAPP